MYYPHALGSQCLVLPEELRAPAMRAMRLVQVMLIAMGNARPLTRREAKMVFCACGRQLFLVLSELNRLTTKLRIARNRRGRGRVRLHVSVPRDPLETDATADTASEEDNPPGHTRYVRGQMAVPGHCFDFPELLRRSGGFHNHSAEIGEATHPTVIRGAFQSVGKQGGADALRSRMSTYVMSLRLWDDIHRTTHKMGPERRSKRKRCGLSAGVAVCSSPVRTFATPAHACCGVLATY